MSYTRVVTFQLKPGTFDRTIDEVQQGLVPTFERSAGFRSYVLVQGDQDKGIAIATFDTREQAEAALKKADEWTKTHTASFVISRDSYVGEVVVEAVSRYEEAGAPRAASPSKEPTIRH